MHRVILRTRLNISQGNCKFGPKCANVHILPNGQRVNYSKGGAVIPPGGHLNLGGRVNPDNYHIQSSALTNSLYRANMGPNPPFDSPYPGFPSMDEFPALGHGNGMEMGVPTIDTSYVSHPGSNYGSPREDDELSRRFGLGLSPIPAKGLSVLDAPLPASFDSNGVSWIARNGPIAASVPSKFGLDSLPGSLNIPNEGRTSEALKNLHNSAFGDDTRDRFNGVAASPPPVAEEKYFGKRLMHSQRYSKPKIMSASVPKSGLAIDNDWNADFTFEEDYIPDNLKDLLTPAEKARRGSRHAEEEARPIYSGTGTPIELSSKYGSPSNASPSRWSPFFQRQAEEEDKISSRTPAFGHVGSPLRNSTLHPGSSPSLRPISRPTTGNSGDLSPYVASPPTQPSVSGIAQQFQQTLRIRAEGGASSLSSAIPRVTSNPIGPPAKRADMDRQVSSSSFGTRFTTPIDEEQGDFVFRMEEEGEGQEDRSQKRYSGNSGVWGLRAAAAAKSPGLGPIGGRTASGSATTIPTKPTNLMFGDAA
jgi:hypothetical protein